MCFICGDVVIRMVVVRGGKWQGGQIVYVQMGGGICRDGGGSGTSVVGSR